MGAPPEKLRRPFDKLKAASTVKRLAAQPSGGLGKTAGPAAADYDDPPAS